MSSLPIWILFHSPHSQAAIQLVTASLHRISLRLNQNPFNVDVNESDGWRHFSGEPKNRTTNRDFPQDWASSVKLILCAISLIVGGLLVLLDLGRSNYGFKVLCQL